MEALTRRMDWPPPGLVSVVVLGIVFSSGMSPGFSAGPRAGRRPIRPPHQSAGVIHVLHVDVAYRHEASSLEIIPTVQREPGPLITADFRLQLKNRHGTALQFAPKQVRLDTDQPVRIVFQKNWRQPALWDIHRPELFDLELRIAHDGRGGSVWKTRLGVRTIRIQGGKLLVNEAPFFLRAIDLTGTRDLWAYKDRIRTWKSLHINALVVQHPTDDLLEACDIQGMWLVVLRGAVSQHHPSVLLTGEDAPLRGVPGVTLLSEEHVSGGGITHAGRVSVQASDVIFLRHHPGFPGMSSTASAAAWMDEEGFACLKDKPLIIGRLSGGMDADMDFVMQAAGMDVSMPAEPAWLALEARQCQALIRAYRRRGVFGVVVDDREDAGHPAWATEARYRVLSRILGDAFAPATVHLIDAPDAVYADRAFQVQASLQIDPGFRDVLYLKVACLHKGRILFAETRVIEPLRSTTERIRCACPAPGNAWPRSFSLKVSLHDGDFPLASRQVQIRAVRSDNPLRKLRYPVSLWDSPGKSAQIQLSRVVFPVRTIADLKDYPGPPATLVVAEGMLDDAQEDAMAALCRICGEGANVLVLHQKRFPQAWPIRSMDAHGHVLVRTRTTHPITKHVPDTWTWADRFRFEGALRLAPRFGWTPLLSLLEGHRMSAVLVSGQVANGRLVLCQLPVLHRLPQEPGVYRLLQQIFEVFQQPRPHQRAFLPVAYAVSDRMRQMLRQLGVHAVVSGDFPDESETADCVLMDGTHSLHAVRERARAYLMGGGVIYIAGATPQQAGDLSYIAGRSLRFVRNRIHADRSGRDPSACGMDGPLRSGIRLTRRHPFSDGLWPHWLGGRMHAYGWTDGYAAFPAAWWVEASEDANVEKLTDPPMLMILYVGNGVLVLDQVLWYERAWGRAYAADMFLNLAAFVQSRISDAKRQFVTISGKKPL